MMTNDTPMILLKMLEPKHKPILAMNGSYYKDTSDRVYLALKTWPFLLFVFLAVVGSKDRLFAGETIQKCKY